VNLTDFEHPLLKESQLQVSFSRPPIAHTPCIAMKFGSVLSIAGEGHIFGNQL